MKNNIFSQTSEPTEADIQRAGYLLWHEYGRTKGREEEFLSVAQEVLRPGSRREASPVGEPAL